MKKVYVIIVTYNAEKWISKCFSSLSNSEHPVHTIVIDNGSKDNTIERIKTEFPEVELIDAKENLGFGKANNIGLSKALKENADYAFLLNQDAWVNPNTIGEMIAVQERNPEYGVLSPIHLNGEGSMMDSNFYDCISTKSERVLHSNLLLHKKVDAFPISFINAALWLISRDCLTNIGGFDPLFYHYGEDKNYVFRLQFHRYKLGVVPSVFGYHDREDRKPLVLAAHTKTRFLTKLLARCSDISKEPEEEISNLLMPTVKKALYSLSKGNLKQCLLHLQLYSSLKKKTAALTTSVITNRKKRTHYIS